MIGRDPNDPITGRALTLGAILVSVLIVGLWYFTQMLDGGRLVGLVLVGLATVLAVGRLQRR